MSTKLAAPSPPRGLKLHFELYLRLRERIELMEYAAGSLMPGEEELARQSGVSRVTVRRTLAALEEDGFIQRVRGRGTFVREAINERTRASLGDALRNIQALAGVTTVHVLEFGVRPAPDAVCLLLGEPPGSNVHWAVRLRSAGPRHVLHLSSWVPLAIAGSWERQDMERNSLQDLLRQTGVVIGQIDQVVSARLAEPNVAASLDVTVGSPLLRVQRTYRTRDGKPITQLNVLGPAAAFELRMTLQPDE